MIWRQYEKNSIYTDYFTVSESIIRRYEDHDHLTQQRAWFAYIVFIVLTIVPTIVLFILINFSPNIMNSIMTMLPIIVVAIISLFLIRAKKYKIAVHLCLIACSIIITLGYVLKYLSPIVYQGFMTYAFLSFPIIIFAALFCERKALVLIMAWFSGVEIIYYISIQDMIAKEMVASVRLALIDSLAGIIFTGIFALLLMTAMRRANVNLVASVSDVRESSAKRTEIAAIIDTSSQNMSNGASAQAAAMEETSASLKEILERTKGNTNIVMDAQKLMQQTTETVRIANTALKDLRHAMDEVNEASVKTVRVVKTIDSIAFQTNLWPSMPL